MAHQRRIIREAVKAALVAAGTSAGSRVFETRMVPWSRVELPAIAVYSSDETTDPDSQQTAPRELKRTLQLAIECMVEGVVDLDDAMDAMAVQIERAMHRDPTFGGACGDSLLTSCELDLAEVGAKELGMLRMVYTVTYYTAAPEAEDVTLSDLKTIDAHYSPDGASDRSEDLIDLEG
jgi:hypothetical protein